MVLLSSIRSISVIETFNSNFFEVLCAFGANLMLCCAGFTGSASGFLIPQLEDPNIGFGITTDEGSWMASIKEIGSLTGAILGAFLSEKIGRRSSLILDSTFFTIGTLLTAFAINLEMILAGRFIQGHSSASAMVSAPMYTCEISQPKVRKYTGLFPVLCWDIGIAVSYLLGASLPWRYAIGVTIIAPITCFILLIICPESPTWLIFKCGEDEARKALIKLRGHKNMDNDIIIQEEFERILLNKELKEEQESVLKRVKSMFDPTFVKPFSFLMVLTIVGVLLCGGPIISYYKVPLLLEAKIQFDPYWTSAWMASFRAIMSCLALPFIGRFMKRTVHFFCSGILIIGLLSLSAFTYFLDVLEDYDFARWIPILAILLIYASHSFGRESIIFALQVSMDTTM